MKNTTLSRFSAISMYQLQRVWGHSRFWSALRVLLWIPFGSWRGMWIGDPSKKKHSFSEELTHLWPTARYRK